MTMRIGFAYNEKPSEDEPPSSEEPLPGAPSSGPDLFAEWDEPGTIAAVEAALRLAGDVIRLEADESFPLALRETRPDIVFNIAEGLYGPSRESHVPAICEFYGVPYTGSDVLSLALSLDKRRAKEAFVARGVPTPDWAVLEPGCTGSLDALRFPVFVKPLYEGSSKGIPQDALCPSREAAVRRAARIWEEYAQPALVEEFLPGREFTCAILGNGSSARVLPLVELLFDALPAGAAPVYGYEAKWVWDLPERPLEIFRAPAEVDAPLAAAVGRVALEAFHALGCRDWSRVDVRLDATGAPHVLEINPLPGILPDPRQNSCFPKAARAAGIDYDHMLLAVLDAALERYGMRR